MGVGARVGTEEDHVAADPPQPEEGLGEAAVVEVALRVDGEAVAAEDGLGGTRLDAAQVHPAHRELLQDLQQGTRVVLVHVGHQGGLVRAGAFRYPARAGNHDKPGHRTRVVLDGMGQLLEPVEPPRDPRADGGVVAGRRIRDLLGGTRRGTGLRHLRVGDHRGQPVAALSGRVPVGEHRGDVVEGGAGTHVDPELDGDHHLGSDHQGIAVDELVEGGGNPALHGVLDRHHDAVDMPLPDRVQSLSDTGEGNATGVVDGEQGLMGERPRGSEISEHPHRVAPGNLP